MSTKVTEDSNFQIHLNVVNDTKGDFQPSGFHTSSGKTKSIIPIAPNTTTINAYFGQGTSGTWTGLVGFGEWQCPVGFNEIATLTLNFDMPFDGGNHGALVGNATFNKLFELTVSEPMPSDGQDWNPTATITMK